MSDLDDLFEGFEKGRQRDIDENAQEEARRRALRLRNADLLRARVLPPLREIAREISNKGYYAVVSEQIETFRNPHIRLTFLARHSTEQNSATRQASTLVFIHSDSGEIEMKEEVKPIRPGETISAYQDRDSTFSHQRLTEDLVREKTMAFIKKVLGVS